MQWSVEALPMAQVEIDALPMGLRARMLRLMKMIEAYGLDQMQEPHVKHLDGKLWELRAKAGEGIARGIYIAVQGRRVVVLHAFVKKTEKTPARALATAKARMAEVLG
jgi:phage-related protein